MIAMSPESRTICTVPKCGDKAVSRRLSRVLCAKHYLQWKETRELNIPPDDKSRTITDQKPALMVFRLMIDPDGVSLNTLMQKAKTLSPFDAWVTVDEDSLHELNGLLTDLGWPVRDKGIEEDDG